MRARVAACERGAIGRPRAPGPRARWFSPCSGACPVTLGAAVQFELVARRMQTTELWEHHEHQNSIEKLAMEACKYQVDLGSIPGSNRSF